MSSSKIAKRYSKALVGLCDKDKSHEHVARDLKKIVDALEENPQVPAALVDPKVGRATKAKVLESIGQSLLLRPLTRNLLSYLNDQGRLGEIEGILLDFNERLDEIAGRIRATVTTAKPLNPMDMSKIKTALEKATGKQVVIESKVDENIVGGVVTRMGNIVLDGSIRTALNNMKSLLLEAVQ